MKLFFSFYFFIFSDREYTFIVDKHAFAVCEYMFSVYEYKILYASKTYLKVHELSYHLLTTEELVRQPEVKRNQEDIDHIPHTYQIDGGITADASGDLIIRPQRTQDDAKGNQRDTRQNPTVFVGTEEGGTNGIARVKPYESEYDASNQGSGHDIGRREDNVKIKAHQILHHQHSALMPRQPIHQILQQVGYYKRTYKAGQQQEPIASISSRWSSCLPCMLLNIIVGPSTRMAMVVHNNIDAHA